MKPSIKVIMILAGIIIFLTIYLTQPAYSDGKFNMFGDKPKTFKIFPDGITYKTERAGWSDNVNIIHDGVEYDCAPSGYHHNMYLNPICVEIILRSIP